MAVEQLDLRRLIDPDEDHLRIHPLDAQATGQTLVLGARVIEERQDLWIVR